MRNFIIFFTLALSSLARADAWDNMTFEQAEAVVAELQSNPYIFSYCDCCDSEGPFAVTIRFLKVKETEIVPCEWDQGAYSVRYQSEVMALVTYADAGPDFTALFKDETPDFSDLIYMNYTWGFNRKTKRATPFFNLVAYDLYGEHNKACKAEFNFPSPKLLKGVSNDNWYKKWYKKNRPA